MAVVGRIKPETAVETLKSRCWRIHGITIDPTTGGVVTVLCHTEAQQAILVEERGVPASEATSPSQRDPGDVPGPWPDA